MSKCLICGAEITPFMSFGRMPIANGFLTENDFDQEYFFDLQVGFCPDCAMVQLTELVDPEKLFHDQYAYFSSMSVHMAQHFSLFAQTVRERYLPGTDPLVVEIGSNDGILLRHFANAGIRHVGVEPSANVAEAGRAHGINTIVRFFNEETAEEVFNNHGPADVLLGANVICHLPNIHSVMRGVQTLLSDKGVFIFEEPYLGDIIQKNSYDQIYDEHYFYFSLHSLQNLFKQYEMEIVDVMPQSVHGGSMRYVVARRGTWPVQPIVSEYFQHEIELGLTEASTYELFKQRVHQSREELRDLLTDLRRSGKRVVAYGATSKSTTVTNFCDIGPDLIEYISDTTPGKHGKYSPGVHIPVVPHEHFSQDQSDYALLFAWNHGEEIIAKEQVFQEQGGRFIVYVPSVTVLDHVEEATV
ncbi:MAG: class I SAM-dependent methyltransferase [Chloroflexota bacterium]